MICSKCGNEFVPTKGFIKYCSWNCRSSRKFTEEAKEKKRNYTLSQWKDDGVLVNIDWKKINQNQDKVQRHKNKFIKKLEDRIKRGEKIWSGTRKKYLIDTGGHKCSLCGVSEWINPITKNTEKVPLVMDHIDGNKNNNNFDNLRIICRNCDGLLPTFCSKNIGRYNGQSR